MNLTGDNTLLHVWKDSKYSDKRTGQDRGKGAIGLLNYTGK